MKGTIQRRRKRTARRKLRIAALALCLALLIVGIIGLVLFGLRARETQVLNEELQELYGESSHFAPSPAPDSIIPEPDSVFSEKEGFQFIGTSLLPGAEKILARNPDAIGWLEIPGMLSLPVVYRDNEYYLTHNFDGKTSDAGTLFLDEHHPFAIDSQYLMIHGHAMHDGSMFGALVKFRDPSVMEKNAYLYFKTLYRQETYKAVAVLEVSEEEMYTLMRLGAPQFVNEAEFTLFAQRIQEEGLHLSDEPLIPGDALLALSTCWKDGRIVVLYKRV